MNLKDKIVDLRENGFCILQSHFPISSIGACRNAFWPTLLDYLKIHSEASNRGPHRHFLPIPFHPPCFSPEFFFDADVMHIVQDVLDERAVADQWGCDVPVMGSQNQDVHVDYQRALFPEAPDLLLPAYMLVISFGLVRVTQLNGPIEIAPGTHRMTKEAAIRAVQSGQIEIQPVPLEIGDVLIRHPWALHRGTPNTTGVPRALVSIRYVRHWYADSSRESNKIPQAIWRSLTPQQQTIMRFPVED
jgi:hypothetical protein